MVRVPGSSEDAGIHRKPQDEKEVKVKIESKTEDPLEDGPLVTQEDKNKESKDRLDLGRGPANKLKVNFIEKN
uniref:Uncharacterized protein n=1 Tax=Peronospora matthiolae TaxID=2874970 RepID=A0AAV1V028_9STRA